MPRLPYAGNKYKYSGGPLKDRSDERNSRFRVNLQLPNTLRPKLRAVMDHDARTANDIIHEAVERYLSSRKIHGFRDRRPARVK